MSRDKHYGIYLPGEDSFVADGDGWLIFYPTMFIAEAHAHSYRTVTKLDAVAVDFEDFYYEQQLKKDKEVLQNESKTTDE